VSKVILPKGEMDPECISLCEALNDLPGISTFESCQGHGRHPFWIFFKASSLQDLLPIVVCINHDSDWCLKLQDSYAGDDFSHIVTLLLEGPTNKPNCGNEFALTIRQEFLDD